MLTQIYNMVNKHHLIRQITHNELIHQTKQQSTITENLA